MQSYPLTNFKMLRCHQNKSRFNVIYSRNSLPAKKDVTSIINLDECKSIETNWIALHVNANNVTFLAALELNIFQKKLKSS